MIRPLRRLHRTTIAVLAIVLVILFIAGLLARPSSQTPNNPRLDLFPLPVTSGGSR